MRRQQVSVVHNVHHILIVSIILLPARPGQGCVRLKAQISNLLPTNCIAEPVQIACCPLSEAYRSLGNLVLTCTIPGKCNSNPHSAKRFPDHIVCPRGFLPRGLSDACQLSYCVCPESVVNGRRLTTLNRSGHSPKSYGLPFNTQSRHSVAGYLLSLVRRQASLEFNR